MKTTFGFVPKMRNEVESSSVLKSPDRGGICKPRAKPWVQGRQKNQSPEGAKYEGAAGFIPPFQGSDVFASLFPGRCPGLSYDAPLGLVFLDPHCLRFNFGIRHSRPGSRSLSFGTKPKFCHYLGVLAPNAKLRSQVILSAGPSAALFEQFCQAQRLMGLDEAAGTGDAEESDIPTPAGLRTEQSRAEPSNPLPEEPMLDPRPQATSKTQKKRRRASYLWAMLIASTNPCHCSAIAGCP